MRLRYNFFKNLRTCKTNIWLRKIAKCRFKLYVNMILLTFVCMIVFAEKLSVPFNITLKSNLDEKQSNTVIMCIHDIIFRKWACLPIMWISWPGCSRISKSVMISTRSLKMHTETITKALQVRYRILKIYPHVPVHVPVYYTWSVF